MTSQSTTEDLCAAWNKSTGQDVNLMVNQRISWQFLQAGFSVADLLIVVAYLKACNSQASESKYRVKLTLLRVIGDLEWYDAQRQLAMAWERNRQRKASPRQEILEASGRPVESTGNARHISEFINLPKN
jgi:hypothetical protein